MATEPVRIAAVPRTSTSTGTYSRVSSGTPTGTAGAGAACGSSVENEAGSLAGNDASEASSTASPLCVPGLLQIRSSRPSGKFDRKFARAHQRDARPAGGAGRPPRHDGREVELEQLVEHRVGAGRATGLRLA